MKIEQLIVQYLYLNKQVTLQGIGTFRLDPSVTLPAGNEKDRDFVMPENAIHFDYNLKAGEDEGLVKHIVQHTRKIYPLASSDLESYSMLAKQFLNIGKPLVIDGVGTVQKNQQGNYQFIPGVFITPRIDDIPKQVREKRDESISFESETTVNNSRRNLLIGTTLVVVLLGGLGAYYFWMKQAGTTPSQPVTTMSATTDTIKRDTAQTTSAPDTAAAASTATNTMDSFKIVVRNYNTAASAVKAFNKFSAFGHQLVVLPAADSLSFELAVPFHRPLADTLKAKDSLKKSLAEIPTLSSDHRLK